MMKGLARWCLYIASYGMVYVILGVFAICTKTMELRGMDEYENLSLFKQILTAVNNEKDLLVILLILIAFSIVWTIGFRKWRNNTRIRIKMTEDSKIEESAFILPYLITVITFNISEFGWIICLFIYLVVGVIFVQTRKLQTSPIFLFSRYHILTDGKIKVITKNTVESFNLKIEDSANGIEARELAKGVYITQDR